MGRARVGGGEPEGFSRRVVGNIERVRDEAGLSNADLIAAAKFSKNYYYTRLRFEQSFTIADIARLASALGVEPAELTAEPPAREARHTRVDGGKLAQRLNQLVQAEGGSFGFAQLDSALRAAGISMTEDAWIGLLDGQGQGRVPQEALLAIADFFKVDPQYLLATRFDDVADRVEAELELKAALREAGVKSVSLRALDTATPDALRAVTKAIRRRS